VHPRKRADSTPANLRIIADEAGVSLMTVSRALRGANGVAEETRQRVNAIAAKHNYAINMLVTGIRTGRTWTAGVMMPVSHSFYSDIISGVHDELAQAKYAMLLSAFPDDYSKSGNAEDLRHLMPLIERRVDGLIFRPTDDLATDLHFEELRRRHIPFVTVDRYLSEAHCDFVGTDDYSGGAMVARHFLELGHHRVAFLAGPDFVSTSRQRRRGFMDTIEEAGAYCTTIQMKDFVDLDAARDFMALNPRPTAAFCVNDPMAVALLSFARERGVKVPQELSISGFADLPESSLVSPSLTTVHQDPKVIGRRAAQVLLKRIAERGKNEAFEMIQITPSLVVRESTSRCVGIE
jgi:LacI family transcriptional regulator